MSGTREAPPSYEELLAEARRFGLTLGTDDGAAASLPAAPRAGEEPLLFHYTSVQALLDIIAKRELWCTEHDGLNDSTEQQQFRGMVRDLLIFEATGGMAPRPSLPRGAQPPPGHDLHTREELGRLLEEHVTTPKFVFSLTSQGDQLSQWRGYAQGGVAVAFKARQLATLALRNRFIFVRCDYGEFGGSEFIKVHYEGGGPIRDRIRSLRDGGGHEKQAALRRCVVALAHLAPAGKNRRFSEEDEWRLFGVEGLSACGRTVVHARPQLGLVRRALLRLTTECSSPVWAAPVAGVVLSPALSRDEETVQRFRKNLRSYTEQQEHPEVWVEGLNIPLRSV